MLLSRISVYFSRHWLVAKLVRCVVCTYIMLGHIKADNLCKAILFSVLYIPNMYYYTIQTLEKPAPIKKKLNFPHILYKEIQKGSVAKSYMTNGLLTYG
jgi:hypothetical protein